jgi:hypothetical protein
VITPIFSGSAKAALVIIAIRLAAASSFFIIRSMLVIAFSAF